MQIAGGYYYHGDGNQPENARNMHVAVFCVNTVQWITVLERSLYKFGITTFSQASNRGKILTSGTILLCNVLPELETYFTRSTCRDGNQVKRTLMIPRILLPHPAFLTSDKEMIGFLVWPERASH